jgi:hypothetical protein
MNLHKAALFGKKQMRLRLINDASKMAGAAAAAATSPASAGYDRPSATSGMARFSRMRRTDLMKTLPSGFESAFNALNHPQFSSPNLTVGSSAFGKVTGQANSPRYSWD